MTSGDGPDTTTTKTLALSDAEFEVTATDDLGLPVSYTAHANYRGTEDYLETIAYTVIGHYKGDRDGEGQAHGAGRYLLPRGSRACTRT